MVAAWKVIHRFAGAVAEDRSTKLQAWRAVLYVSGGLMRSVTRHRMAQAYRLMTNSYRAERSLLSFRVQIYRLY